MAAHGNAAPVIIIKRKKVVGGGGHHGGAWKVAYADFVTAMMAFFMLMWLLNATTEQQRKGIADYFSPTLPINRVSGGGNGSFGGDSIFSEETLPKSGVGGTDRHAAEEDKARGDTGVSADGATDETPDETPDEVFDELAEWLRGHGGESTVMDNKLRHVVTRITDEGMVIELFELDEVPLFEGESAEPTQLLRDLAVIISDIAKTVRNPIAIGGYVRSDPVVLAHSHVWEQSSQRATTVRKLLEGKNIVPDRIHRVTGYADRKPVVKNPMARRNNRVEIVLLRDVPRN